MPYNFAGVHIVTLRLHFRGKKTAWLCTRGLQNASRVPNSLNLAELMGPLNQTVKEVLRGCGRAADVINQFGSYN